MARQDVAMPSSAELKALQAEVAANADKVPAEALEVFVQCQSALMWGGGWSLIGKDDEDYARIAQHISEFGSLKQVLRFSSVQGGVVLDANPQWLLQILNTLAPSASKARGQEYMQRITEAAEDTNKNFDAFWKRVLSGKSDLFNPKDSNGNAKLPGVIGVYCTNVDNYLTVNGVRYKAFRAAPQIILSKIAQAPQANRIQVAAHKPSGDGAFVDGWVPLEKFASGAVPVAQAMAFPVDVNGNVINRPNALIMRIRVV